jgi:AraC-like DNA-binding protein/quercetin dioxygenase-like cupin family protein
MSRNSQISLVTEAGMLGDPARAIVARALDHEAGIRYPPHSHARAQLVYAVSGVLTVATSQGSWLVPPQQAVWVPADITHEVRAPNPVAMRNLYLHPDAVRDLPGECRVIAVSGLLRELILRAVEVSGDRHQGAAESRIGLMILDELRGASAEPLHLPLPRDRRVRAVTEALTANPGDRRPLARWARAAGASERTLARLFIRETGLTFAAWRQRLRLLGAIQRLADGESITGIAYDLGYESPSAFIAMFSKTLGATPGRYLKPGP